MKRKKILAWLLTLCLIIGMLPGVTLPAAAAGGKTVYVGGSGEGHYATLQEAYAALGGAAGTIMLTGNTQLTEPLRISSDVEISGSGTISPTGGNWTATNPGNSGAPYNTMIQITGGTVTMGPGVIVDANSMCRCISVNTTDGAAKLVLDGTRIQNGAMSQAHGAGIILQDGAELEASGGARFESNICDSGTVASGGALYVWRDSKATLDDVTFTGNKANSGGAIYTYRGTVTTTANTKFVGNWASQRGGAIHDHGLVVMHGTTISGNSSDQYGGGVYVSADIYLQGQLVMDNATITGNSAGNSGAGVFVATDAQLFLGGSSSVNGNNLTNAGSVPADYLKNNIYVATATSKLIIYSDLSKESGISTSNPYWPKVVVYSLATSGVSFPSGTGVSADSGYMISSATKAKLSYDSAVWLLKDTASDPGAAAEDPNCKEGNLWLGINPDYGGGDPSADTVIFDFNLPGKEAIVYTGRTPGTTISLPSVSNESTGAVTYKFRGWYTEPVGGSKLSDPLTVEAGTHVYYAQWDVQTDSGSGGGGVPGDADMYLVYFDQNYEGGGLTTAYVTAGTFSFTNKRFLVYDIRDLGKQLRTFGMVVVMDQIWNRITRNRAIGRHTWLYIDEMQLLFSNEFSANYFFELWSRSRKWGAIPTGITQNVETLLLSDLARRMLSNSRFILMFNQATSDRVELANLLNISNRQLDYVTNADSGQGLLFAGKSIVPFINNVPKNTKLYQMMTTKLEEVTPSSGRGENGSSEG